MAGPYFYPYAQSSPAGHWAYELDDFGVVYGPGLVAFPPRRTPHDDPDQPRHRVPRLEKRIRHPHPLAARAGHRPAQTAPPPQGMGGAMVLDARVTADLTTHAATVDTQVPSDFHAQASEADRILRFLLNARHEHDAGARRPTTAYDRWRTRQHPRRAQG